MLRQASIRTIALLSVSLLAMEARAQDLVVDGTTMTLGGVHRYDRVRVINGGRIVVPVFNGTDPVNTGNLELIAAHIEVDATSSIDARGAGYQTARCANGRGPTGVAGGRGGCAVHDSGGGGAHFGGGGRGTTDCNQCGSATSCQFPSEFEQDCGNSLNSAGTACTSTSSCRPSSCSSRMGVPSVAGIGYRHSIYEIEFGSSGGDKGCRDGDGFGSDPAVGGAGGGRLVLAALTSNGMGTIRIDGRITAAGRRGCGIGNDSGGGGAGGSILIVGDAVQVGSTARVSAAGGLGGDTFAAAVGQPDYADCPAGAQTGGTCDDCGGGGGGGVINVLSRTSTLDHRAQFDVAGADGGVCEICRGEAGGGAGELLLDGAYVGEFCDGYDNDFDGHIDEGLGRESCGFGECAREIDACDSGVPVTCSPTVDPEDASCRASDAGARPRIAVVLDTSSSMLLDLEGYPTFGDGSVERPGIDTDGNGAPDDSRLFLAREALAQVISAYPEVDFALARYHQDQGFERSCQIAKWFECSGLIGTYDNPTDNTGDVICNVAIGPSTQIPVREISMSGDECINYAGTCGPPRRGADILSGFGTPTRDLVRWLDGRETAFDADVTPGDVCRHRRAGRDCEVRASGVTPLAGSLQAIEDYMVPIRATDPSTGCRGYSVILVTDGTESCDGDPAAQAARLFGTFGIETYVIAVSVLAAEEASLNAIASAGSGGARPTATFVRNPAELVPAITSILEGSLRTERCNAIDDDCDGVIDEGFSLNVTCYDDGVGVCRGTGATRCAANELGVECQITVPGASAGLESCNAMDDDCDEAIDEGLTCVSQCVPSGPEVCNSVDDNCNGLIDEADPAMGTPCGEGAGECTPGALRCVSGELMCIGAQGPRDEVCNGLDDDCDGEADNLAACPGTSLCVEGSCRRNCDPNMEFPCPVAFRCEMPEGEEQYYCVPTACASCAPHERCIADACIDPCEGVTCDAGEVCRGGDCVGCEVLGCEDGQVCFGGACRENRCTSRGCSSEQTCFDGDCWNACGAGDCPRGQRCATGGQCEADPCSDVNCPSGRVCVAGECRSDPCRGIVCAAGEVCTGETGCIPDPCRLVACSTGRICAVNAQGIPECTRTGSADAGVDRRVLVTGGNALCSVRGPGVGSTGGIWALFLAAMVAIVVRRGRAK